MQNEILDWSLVLNQILQKNTAYKTPQKSYNHLAINPPSQTIRPAEAFCYFS